MKYLIVYVNVYGSIYIDACYVLEFSYNDKEFLEVDKVSL